MISVFHGSTVEIAEPLARAGRAKVDFGKGFYVTKIRRQAADWAETIAERRDSAVSVLNEYEYDAERAKELCGGRYKIFPEYNLEWLEYVADCRRGGELQKKYDVVEGGIADDRVIDTVEDYEQGIITAEQALGQLVSKKVNHQTAILSQKVIDECIRFKGCIYLGGKDGGDA